MSEIAPNTTKPNMKAGQRRDQGKSPAVGSKDRNPAADYRGGHFQRIADKFMGALLHLGMRMGPTWMLTVRGRKSGEPQTNPVDIFEMNENRYIIGLHGVGSWVHNIRAAGTGTLARGRQSEAVRAVELTPKEAAPILKERLRNAPSFLRRRFNATPDSPLEDFEDEALRHPVFRVEKAFDIDPIGTRKDHHSKLMLIVMIAIMLAAMAILMLK